MKVSEKKTDLILISDAKTSKLEQLTRHAISSAGKDINIIVVESHKSVSYEGATVIYPDIPFNYNAYLNLGARQGNAEYILFANNDIFFYENWEVNLRAAMDANNVVSASPICPKVAGILKIGFDSNVLYGYELITRFCGWAFMWTREFYEYTGGLDESFKFWCSDNVTVEQLLKYNKQHILVPSSVVLHINNGRNTLNHLDPGTVSAYTDREVKKYNRLFKKNLWKASHFKIRF